VTSNDMIVATGNDELLCAVTAQTNVTCAPCCAPAIKVYKQVVCYTNPCEPFNPDLNTQKTAKGATVTNSPPAPPPICPAFCYKVTVTNAGNVTLTNLQLSDHSTPGPDLPVNLCGLNGLTMPVGFVTNCFVPLEPITRCADDVNVVTATASGLTTGGTAKTVTAMDTNTVTIVPISVKCELSVSTNGPSGTFFVPSICATQEVALGTNYCVRIKVTNNGGYALQNVSVSDELGTFGNCFASPAEPRQLRHRRLGNQGLLRPPLRSARGPDQLQSCSYG